MSLPVVEFDDTFGASALEELPFRISNADLLELLDEALDMLLETTGLTSLAGVGLGKGDGTGIGAGVDAGAGVGVITLLVGLLLELLPELLMKELTFTVALLFDTFVGPVVEGEEFDAAIDVLG